MQLVATLNNSFFRAVTVKESEIEKEKEFMLTDQSNLQFHVMSDEEFEDWLVAH